MTEPETYPFGDEITSTSNDREKFATYNRDSYTGLDYANQRYFASTYGWFNTPDLTGKGMGLSEPESFNRYSYVLGDPVNHSDPHGTCAIDVTDDPDQTDYSDCLFDSDPYGDLPDIGFDTMIGAQIASAIASAQQVGQQLAAPKCWQNTGNISATLSNLGNDIETDVANQFSGQDLQLLTSDINSDIASEMVSLKAIAAQTIVAPGKPYYIGGHFNLNLSASQVADFSQLDQQAFASDFGGSIGDGVRQAASTGLAKAGAYDLHSHGQLGSNYSFHFDRFNPLQDVAGTVGHFGYDVLGGHLGHPCLDPAWH